MKRRRLLCLLLAVLLLAALAPARTTAAPTVYFTSANDQLLPELSDSTMPFWSDGQLYVPYTVVSGTDLGVFYARSRDKTTSVVYRQGIALTFDFAAKTAIDQDGNSYPYHAIVRGDVVFLPVALLAEFFSLDYSYTRVTYGYLVRVKSDTVVLSDARFIEAASASMEQRYNEYLKTYRDNTGTDAPAPELTDDSIERAYLLVRVTEEGASGALLDALTGTDDTTTFLFTEETVSAYGALARRVTVSGSAIALAVDASGGSRQTIGAIERANRALWSACNEKARLVLLENATEETTRAVQEAGYCPIALELDYSGDTLPALYRLSNSISTMARKTGCAVYLGTDSAVQERWSGLLARLRAVSCPISRLSELSARRES